MKKVFEIEWLDNFGPMSSDNLILCLKGHIGHICNVTDITEVSAENQLAADELKAIKVAFIQSITGKKQ